MNDLTASVREDALRPTTREAEPMPAGEPAAASASAATAHCIVGIGASAGGLESLERFFDALPRDTGMAFVIIQHLSPDFRSLMDELLARHTRMPIHRAEEAMVVEPNQIYLLPPRKEMVICDGRLQLTDKDPKKGLTLPIDRFFRSLAQDCGSRAIGIILSGTGSDGSRGVRDIARSGGLVICESEESAQFDGMPLSAQATGVVDLVLTADEMGAALLEYKEDAAGVKTRKLSLAHAPSAEQGLEAIFALLRREHDIDFSHYREGTVTRRIERRITLARAHNLDEYVDRLWDDPEELNALYKDLLIGVTRFFRDADAFRHLGDDVLPRLMQDMDGRSELRVWVAGCATGEEAYSIAILLDEATRLAPDALSFHVFATDIHKASLEQAARGVFDAERLEAVSPQRLERYFRPHKDGYHIVPELRERIVFAQHNVLRDAPFTNLDLVACRNLLIYFQPEAQKKALSLFHFGLRRNGVLLLGSSESPGDLASEFETLDERSKLYRKLRDRKMPLDVRLPSSRTLPLASRPPAQQDGTLLRAYDALLDRFMPPSLLINEKRELLDSFAGAHKLLTLNSRRPSNDVLTLFDTDVRGVLSAALHRVMRAEQPCRLPGVAIRHAGTVETYELSIEPVSSGRETNYLISLLRRDAAAAHESDAAAPLQPVDLAKPAVSDLEDELRHTRENLQNTVEELESSNEELQATNEELIASNEELQSANEELHSVNEELYTVNAEHQHKIQELAELNQDMNHLLASTDVAILFLDRDLCIRKFTPRMAGIFDLLPQDVGRKIASFTSKIEYGDLTTELRRVLDGGAPLQTEVRDAESHCYFLRILPYRVEDRIDGVVLSLVDISALDETRHRLVELSAIVDHSSDAIIGWNAHHLLTSWNAGAERLYGYRAEEVIGQPWSIVVHPEDFKAANAVEQRVLDGEAAESFETTRLHEDGRRIELRLTLSPVRSTHGTVIGVCGIARDLSELKATRRERDEREERLSVILQSALDAIVSIDERGTVIRWNPRAEHLFGYTEAEAVGKPLAELIIPEALRARHVVGLARFMATGATETIGRRLEMPAVDKSGREFPVELTITANRFGDAYEFTGFARDVTERRKAEQEMRDQVHQRERFLAMLSHELRTPLNALAMATHILARPAGSGAAQERSRLVIERQTAHLTRLLDDLLDVARLTQNKIVLRKERIELTESTRAALDTVRWLADERGIVLRTDLPTAPVPVYCDPARLQQAQVNLLVNAIKYSFKGATVDVTMRLDGDRVRVAVRDAGAGIPPHLLQRIFDLFYQSDQTLDRASGGMGVGLTLVRWIIENHDGTVEAKSDGLGKGSDFTFALPLASSTHAGPLPRASFAQGNGCKVVLVEDQSDSRETLQTLLEFEGFAVHTAADGREGLAVIERERPRAAIVDIGLPVMNGYELARALRDRFGSAVWLIALTGYGQPEDHQRAREAGFDDHLIKPCEPATLVQLLQRISG